MRRISTVFVLALLLVPLTGSLTVDSANEFGEWYSVDGVQYVKEGQVFTVPQQGETGWALTNSNWWEWTSMDSNRNSIHDSLEVVTGPVWIGLSYSGEVTDAHISQLNALGLDVVDVIEAVDAVLLGQIDSALITQLSQLDDVVMVERYGQVVFYGDVQTPAVKAMASADYPVGAWDLGVSGEGVVIAMVDTGVDNEHPGLNEKFVAGYDAVCYVHSDPLCVAAGGRVEDGTFDPDDGNQHGTACMGMASATGLDASGAQTEFYGSAPDAALVDVRIGTDLGAGPFENYLISQEFYESAMNGLQWIIDNKDTAWQGADESEYGIDIISLSWGITSHEGGGSDGKDMHSRILDEAMAEGIVVSVAAGNDGPDNDGLSGMGSSDTSITVGATDDINTVNREDDTIASYSSRGPRRDNGDTNPLNEMKPEVTAPGTNIIQAEGCVTSGMCNNFIGGDASQNGYTGRGSGTSYATPAVSGIIAMMLEANPEMPPLEIKEVLKFTAERRGDATQPEFDPFWNKDFGWGMVDAYEAVKLTQYLVESGLTGQIDVHTQVHLESSALNEGGLWELNGSAWGQMGSVTAVEYRIGEGDWKSASYEEGVSGAMQRFSWSVAIDPSMVASGNQTIEVRAINEEGVQGLPILTVVSGEGGELESSSSFTTGQIIAVVVALVALCIIGLIVQAKTEEPLSYEKMFDQQYDSGASEEVLEAELLDDAENG